MASAAEYFRVLAVGKYPGSTATMLKGLHLVQGRRKLPKGGAAIRHDARGRTVADSISARSVEKKNPIIQFSCQEIALVVSRYIESHALTSCSSILSLSIQAEIVHTASLLEFETHDPSLVATQSSPRSFIEPLPLKRVLHHFHQTKPSR